MGIFGNRSNEKEEVIWDGRRNLTRRERKALKNGKAVLQDRRSRLQKILDNLADNPVEDDERTDSVNRKALERARHQNSRWHI